jgi:hypothetical protein
MSSTPTPCPRTAGSTETSQSYAKVTESVTTRAYATCLPVIESNIPKLADASIAASWRARGRESLGKLVAPWSHGCSRPNPRRACSRRRCCRGGLKQPRRNSPTVSALGDFSESPGDNDRPVSCAPRSEDRWEFRGL